MIPQGSTSIAYEIDSFDDQSKIHCTLTHYSVDSNVVDVGGINRQPMGIPLLFSFHASLSCAQIYDKILTYVVSFAKIDSSGSMSKEFLRSKLRLRVCSEDGRPMEIISSDADETLPAILGKERTKFVYFGLDWVDIVSFASGSSNKQIHYTNLTTTACHSSYLEQEKKLSSGDTSFVSLYECFESFTQPGKSGFIAYFKCFK
jgi:hypothetical protein